jgi:hypothetical protein
LWITALSLVQIAIYSALQAVRNSSIREVQWKLKQRPHSGGILPGCMPPHTKVIDAAGRGPDDPEHRSAGARARRRARVFERARASCWRPLTATVVDAICGRLGASSPDGQLAADRYDAEGAGGGCLADCPRAGRPEADTSRDGGDDHRGHAHTPLPDQGTHWSTCVMAARRPVQIQTTIISHLARGAHGVKLHSGRHLQGIDGSPSSRQAALMSSRALPIRRKRAMGVPRRCRRAQIQALNRTRSPGPGLCSAARANLYMTHVYERHGTTTLLRRA